MPTTADLAWGPVGAAAAVAGSDVVVVIDVLSFSTAVTVAVERGATVVPWALGREGAAEEAARVGAVLAVQRGDGDGGPSLSPASLLHLEPGQRILLPSPNGSAISALVAGAGRPVLAGGLRNAGAAARVAAGLGERVLVVAAGERWPDGSLRPALEDLLGAGAVIDALGGEATSDAQAARAAFRALRGTLAEVVEACPSGQELVERGHAEDVRLAAALDASVAVPLLRGGAYAAA